MTLFKYCLLTVILSIIQINFCLGINVDFDIDSDVNNDMEKDIYCIDISNIKPDDIDLISCEKMYLLTECHKCIDLSFKVKRNVPNICVVELYDICKQEVKNLDNCNNRCPNNCFCSNSGICRKMLGKDSIPCNQS